MKKLLDEEFKALEKSVREKVAEAAKLLGEANKLAKDNRTTLLDIRNHAMELAYKDDDLDSSDDAFEIFEPLISELEEGGWMTSAMEC